jgi:hypothetical protein
MVTVKDLKEYNMRKLINQITERFAILENNLNQPEKNHSRYDKENLYNWLYVQLSKDALKEWVTPTQYKKVMKHLGSVYNSHVEKIAG